MKSIGYIAEFLKNSLGAIYKGEFLLRLKADKYFMHIIYLFILMWVSIWLSIKIDATLTQVEHNKAVLSGLEISYSEKTSQLVRLNRFSTVESELRRMGSDVTVPDRPATKIGRR